MNEGINDNDKFWLSIGGVVLMILMTIAVIKHDENEKFAPIKQQINEETALMNIRVLN